jgi:parallel beta-helix repeat protein
MILTTLCQAFRKLFTPSLHNARTRGCRPTLEGLETRWVPATLVVDAAAGPYRHIQDAIDAARAGDTVLVKPGTYAESLTITKNNLHLIAQSNQDGDHGEHDWDRRDEDGRNRDHDAGGRDGDRDRQSPAVTLFAPVNLSSTGAVIDVNGGTGVEIAGFVVDGQGEVLDAAVRVVGGGSATIHDNLIQDTFQNSSNNNNRGYSIRVGDDGDVLGHPSPGTATIEDNVLQSYNKGGVIVDGTGSSADIHDNRVAGVGPTTTLPQNGLQIGFGASGRIAHNVIQDNDFNSDAFTATGILVFNTTAASDITHNVLDHDGTGIILFQSSHSLVAHNKVASSSNDGISLLSTTYSVVEHNHVLNSGQHSGGDGISLIDSQHNRIADNEVSGSLVFGGISLDTSNSNDIEHNDLENNQAYGILLTNSNHNEIEENELEHNGTYGLWLQNSNNNELEQNHIFANGLAGIRLEDSSSNTIDYNVLIGNGDGISLSNSPNNSIFHNTVHRNA